MLWPAACCRESGRTKEMNGHIKIDRRILRWEWYRDRNTFKLFIHLILRANWKDGRFQGVEIPRGSLASSYQNLANETGLSVQNVRTAVKKLKNTGELTVSRQAKFSVFTVKNYSKYQTLNTEINSQPTGDQQAANRQLTTIEEGKEGKKERREKEGASAPPTLENVTGYCREHGLVVDAEHFFRHYSSRNWMSGKTRVTDWKGKLRDWDRQDRKKSGEGSRARATGFSNFEQRDYDMGELERQLLESQGMRPPGDAGGAAPAARRDGTGSVSEGGEEK